MIYVSLDPQHYRQQNDNRLRDANFHPCFIPIEGSINRECLIGIWVISLHNRVSHLLSQQESQPEEGRSYPLQPMVYVPSFYKHIPSSFQNIKILSCGESHWIASTFNNQILSSGYNSYGQLGTGDKHHHLHDIVDITDNILKSITQQPPPLATGETPPWTVDSISAGFTWTHLLITQCCADATTDESDYRCHHSFTSLLGWGNNSVGASARVPLLLFWTILLSLYRRIHRVILPSLSSGQVGSGGTGDCILIPERVIAEVGGVECSIALFSYVFCASWFSVLCNITIAILFLLISLSVRVL